MIPEDLFAGILNEGGLVRDLVPIARQGFAYPPGPPPFEIISLLDCE